MDFKDYSEEVQKYQKELKKITFDLLRSRTIYHIDGGSVLLKVNIEHDEWLQTVFLRDKEKITIIRAEETFPNNFKELTLEKSDIDWLKQEMDK